MLSLKCWIFFEESSWYQPVFEIDRSLFRTLSKLELGLFLQKWSRYLFLQKALVINDTSQHTLQRIVNFDKIKFVTNELPFSSVRLISDSFLPGLSLYMQEYLQLIVNERILCSRKRRIFICNDTIPYLFLLKRK